MSSSSFVDVLEDMEGMNEYPFPTAENANQRSPSDSGSDLTPPYLARSLPQHRSSSGSAPSSSRRRRPQHDREPQGRDRDRDDDSTTPAKLLSRLARSEYRDSKHTRTLLVLTNDKLEAETRRADLAEQRIVEVLHRLRAANEATALAQADAQRAQQEVRLYQIQLEAAQREITRAQDIVDQVERLRKEAEEEAAKARSVARKCREEVVLSRAREEGRKQGYAEGLERGRKLGFTEASKSTSRPPRRAAQATRPPLPEAEEQSEDMEVDVEEASPPPPPARHRVDSQRHPSYVPTVQRTQSPPDYRTPSRSTSRRTPPNHIPDFAPIGAGIPVPTLTTPINPPSPSHTRPPSTSSPRPLPIPEPRPRSHSQSHSYSRDPVPIPIREPPRSPLHPPIDIPPDNYIPYARDNDTSSIHLPPPHEMSRPVSPVSPTAGEGRRQMEQEQELGSRETIVPIEPRTYEASVRSRDYAPSVRSRDYAPSTRSRDYEPSTRSRDYAYPTTRSSSSRLQPPQPSGVQSPQSRTSTRISEYDIVGRPGYNNVNLNVYRMEEDPVGRADVYAEVQQAYRPREPSVPEYAPEEREEPPEEDLSRPIYKRHGSSQSSGGALGRLFRRKSKSKRSPDGERDSHPAVPDIVVESPSTDNSRPSSAAVTVPQQPEFLSPEHAHNVLPSLSDMLYTNTAPAPSQSNSYSYSSHSNPPQPSHWDQHPGSPYIEAPVPANIVYPEPPMRTRSRAEPRRVPVVPSSSDGTGDDRSFKSRRGADSGSLGGRLSPISLFK
ncbi:hypothetical protein BDW22DRAFT_409106 [Trametopsis cervina]|nr:hypothetical protein BDW22DRAFT_409106 [Trametopsis cervina]